MSKGRRKPAPRAEPEPPLPAQQLLPPPPQAQQGRPSRARRGSAGSRLPPGPGAVAAPAAYPPEADLGEPPDLGDEYGDELGPGCQPGAADEYDERDEHRGSDPGYPEDDAYPGDMAPAPLVGPFSRPLFNQIVRGVSILASLIAIILEFLLLSQGVSTYMKRGLGSADSDKATASSSKEEDEKPSKTRTSERKKPTSSSSKEELLGRAYSTLMDLPGPTARFVKRALIKRQNDKSPSPTKAPSLDYTPGTDVPTRGGAVAFTAAGHLFAALLFCLLLYFEWLLFTQRPSPAGIWTPLVIAFLQFFIAFEILGRAISSTVQGGAYVLLVAAIVNLGLAAWTVSQSRKMAPPPEPYYDDYPPEQGPPMDQQMLPEDGAEKPLDGAPDEPEAPAPERPARRSRRVSNGASIMTDDIDSYYQRSPSTYKGPRSRSQPRRMSHGPAAPAPAHHQQPYAGAPPTTPISLYGPEEYQRRLEQQRRSQRRSLIQPVAQYDPVQNTYIQPASNFRERAPEAVREEDEDEEHVDPFKMRPDDPRISRDGFANRAKEWKRLQGR